MNVTKFLFKAGPAGFALGAVLLLPLTGCVLYADGPGAGAEGSAMFPDDYIYYPNYEVYYSSSRRQYAYLDGTAWVSRPAPRGVTVAMLQASPSVKMEFHDRPANHHAAVVQQYPKNWAPPSPGKAPEEKRDEHRPNDGK